jgi:hypothetical protein
MRLKIGRDTMRNSSVGMMALAAAFVAVGCGSPTASADNSAGTSTAKKYTYKFTSDAGISIAQEQDNGKLKKLYASRGSKYGSARQDPFALTKDELEFETSQGALRTFNETGGYQMDYVPSETEEVAPTVEQQPYRRLSGIVVGDSVLAIIDMNDGSESQIIHPGERIPNSPWTVVSIDKEKAVLRRDGNVLPKEITVRLETPPPGQGGFSGGATGPGAGAGYPGGPGAGAGYPGGGRGFPGGGRGFPGGPGGPGFPGGPGGK